MNKTHHPHNRAERLKLKQNKLVHKSKGRPNRAKQHAIEEVREKELDDEARREVQGIES